MVAANYQVYQKYTQVYENGVAALEEIIYQRKYNRT